MYLIIQLLSYEHRIHHKAILMEIKEIS
jgi:hypothetical protein